MPKARPAGDLAERIVLFVTTDFENVVPRFPDGSEGHCPHSPRAVMPCHQSLKRCPFNLKYISRDLLIG
jgi:hypothetical protein